MEPTIMKLRCARGECAINQSINHCGSYCAQYLGSNYIITREMPGMAPSFLRFAQTAHEAQTCVAPRVSE